MNEAHQIASKRDGELQRSTEEMRGLVAALQCCRVDENDFYVGCLFEVLPDNTFQLAPAFRSGAELGLVSWVRDDPRTSRSREQATELAGALLRWLGGRRRVPLLDAQSVVESFLRDS